jgi:hypothetical protein
MKIVINKCYGGFGISLEALTQLVIRNADCVESCTPKHYYGGDNEKFKNKNDWQKKWDEDFSEFEDIGNGFKADKIRQYNVYKDGLLYMIKDRSDNSTRTDKDLVDIVEKMGEEASGSLSELQIVEVPDDVKWEIDEYDGIESIHEVHRSW